MAQLQQRLSELTIEEFVILIKATVRDVLEEQQHDSARAKHPQAGLLELPPISVGGQNPQIPLISREEYDGDAL